MTSTGLSRRRVGASAAHDEEPSVSWSTNPTNGVLTPSASSANISSGSSSTPASHAGSAFAGGSKIAFDPRDIEREDDDARSGGRMPRLTIMEEVLLLGLKDRQGYLSFWNDNISYALRGCILLELALRRRIAIVKDSSRRRMPLPDRLVEVIDERQTGETILDEALKMMKAQESAKMAVNSWIDLLSGETWNVLKINYQLKQVRERLAKGLVDKGVLRTEKRNFLLFDMATHPVADARTKDSLVTRCVALLTAPTSVPPPRALAPEGEQCRVTRSILLVCAAHAANVLDNALGRLGYEEREGALQRCEDISAVFASWPFGAGDSQVGAGAGAGAARPRSTSAGGGTSGRTSPGGLTSREAVSGLLDGVRREMHTRGAGVADGEDLCFELVAAVLEVLAKLDSLL